MKVRILLLAVLWPALASAEIYKWTDATGKLHYSQNPPPGTTKFEKVTPPPPPLPPSENLQAIHQFDAGDKGRSLDEAIMKSAPH